MFGGVRTSAPMIHGNFSILKFYFSFFIAKSGATFSYKLQLLRNDLINFFSGSFENQIIPFMHIFVDSFWVWKKLVAIVIVRSIARHWVRAERKSKNIFIAHFFYRFPLWYIFKRFSFFSAFNCFCFIGHAHVACVSWNSREIISRCRATELLVAMEKNKRFDHLLNARFLHKKSLNFKAMSTVKMIPFTKDLPVLLVRFAQVG